MTMHEVVHEMVVGECHEPNSEGSGSAWKAYINARVAGLFLLVLLEYPNTQIPIATTVAPGMFKLDLDPLAPRLLQNREAHIYYLKHTQEQADILRGIVEQTKAKQPLDNELDLAYLKVAFQKNTYFIRNLEGVDLLSGSRYTHLYTISFYDMLKTSSICLLSKASKTKSWLWNRRLSHLNVTQKISKMSGKVDALTFGPASHVGDENGSSMGGDTHVRVSDNTNPKDREYLSIVSVHEAINSDCMRNASNVTTNMHKSPNVEEVSECNDSKILIHSIDDVANFFGVSLKSFKELDDFTKELEAVVEMVSIRFEHTLYGYFIRKRMAFSIVEYYVRNNWAKHGLTRIMMNNKCFFFFKFNSWAGLEAVLKGDPWLLCKSPIILKNWSIYTRLLKKELTRIPIWVKLHDVLIHVFEEDDISLIATVISKHIMIDSYTSSMCNDSWGRNSFARCLIKVNSNSDLVKVVTIGVPSLTRDDFTKETIRVEYEWKPPRCDLCKIYGHVHDDFPNKVVSPPIVTNSNVVTLIVEKTNDGFQTVGKKKKRNGKSKSTNGGQFAGHSVKQNTLRDFYENVGISHQTSVARTPQQNGVVERQNRTLMEAARTIKTPYELMHDKKPELSFLYIFGLLCYPTNDSEDLGKLNEKADIDSTSQGSSSNVRQSHTLFQSLGRWTKDLLITNVIEDSSRSVSMRKQLKIDAMWCYFDVFLTNVEPKNFKQVVPEPSWIDAMQEEIHEFERLQVWVLKNKAGLVAQQFRQEEGINFEESFAPVTRIEAIRAVDPTLFTQKAGNDLLLICPRLPNKEFVDPPSEDELVSFINELDYSGRCEMLSAIHTDQLHHPWRTFTAITNSLLGTLKFVSKTKDCQKYGALTPDGMVNQEIKDSKAYKTYYDYATGKDTPKKARKFKKVASPSKRLSPVLEEEPIKKPKKVKKPAKKSTTVPTIAAQVKEALKKSKKDSHMLHPSGSGDGVLVPNQSKGDDDKAANDADGDNDASDSEKTDSDDEKEETKDDEYVHTPDYYVPTDEETNGENKEFYDEVYDELYKDVNVRSKVIEHEEVGKGDTEMTDKTKGSKQSSSISSDFASKFLNLDNVPPVIDELASMMNVKVRHEESSTQAPPILSVHVTAIPKTSTVSATTVPPSIQPFTPIPQSPQTWLSRIAQKEKPPLTFDELMSTPIDFSIYVMNNLKIDNLTQKILVGHAFNLFKGTCKSFVELEYNFKECYKAVTDRLDWNNPEGHEYPFDFSKLLLLIEAQGRQVVPANYFFNNDLEYLKVRSSSRKYTTSTTKIKAAKYVNFEGIEDMFRRYVVQ
nr:zinc knuckle CX2CX4HX4C [Tanacetum cinerariifolium]